MKRSRLILLGLAGFFALSAVVQANPHTRIEARRRARNKRIERITRVRHAHTPWYKVATHAKIALQAIKLKSANNRIAKKAHQRVQRVGQVKKRIKRRWGEAWKMGFGLGMSKWH